MYNPRSTYRIQFHKEFTFKDLENIVPYLKELGIGTIYASPIFKAVPGSMHGYDGVDPLQINPEIGTIEQLREVSSTLKANNIGWIQDIVPNHMAFHSDNNWLMDVLEKGRLSPWYHYFDIDHNPNAGPVMVPFLGADLDSVIEDKELQIVAEGGKIKLAYSGNSWPANLASYQFLLEAGDTQRPKEVDSLLKKITKLTKIKDAPTFQKDFTALTSEFKKLIESKSAGKWISGCIKIINDDKKYLLALANLQFYRLCKWDETDHSINYRRFFTVNGLICLNIQRPEAFDDYHRLIAQLIKEKIFDGLRVDHIDGLYDPEQYLVRLRELAGPDIYIVVEKILEPGETMSRKWPVQGNTGYDFLAQVNNLLVVRKGEVKLAAFYKTLSGNKTPLSEQIAEKKQNILNEYMAGELENLTQYFIDLKLATNRELDVVSRPLIKIAIGEFLINCPVYRFYGNVFPLDRIEAEEVKSLLENIIAQKPQITSGVKLLINAFVGRNHDKGFNVRALSFYQRCMQFTGPLMAKGVEDTLMYTDSHFIAHNEVGDSPEAAGSSVDDFHQAMVFHQQYWPSGMNGTATHDTKRGEDVRARLQVLPDLADEWLELVYQWQRELRTLIEKRRIHRNDVYFIFQTLLGVYPMPGDKELDFQGRMEAYLEKTLREGKERSNWAQPDVAYEKAVKSFAADLMKPANPFLSGFHKIHAKIADFGILNSLSQVILKFTCPGIPDVYQGCEHWDLSLVDPDNRRPVDYTLRRKLLSDTINSTEIDIQKLWDDRRNGEIKAWLTQLLAKRRSATPDLFTKGKYLPLKVAGKYKAHLLAFARQFKKEWLVVVIPLGPATLVDELNLLNSFDWEDTEVILPATAPKDIENLLTGESFKSGDKLNLNTLFGILPFGFFSLSEPGNKRGAGILLPLASLPSSFGIGDLGPEARQFADTLNACGQKYWQLLPLSPVSAEQQYSPYSSYASFAGNEWYISPQLLVEDGLLSQKDLRQTIVKNTASIDYPAAAIIKERLLNLAWNNFKVGKATDLALGFKDLCRVEQSWLDDYALFTEIRKYHANAPWHRWPDKYKLRNVKALKDFSVKQQDEIQRSKWLQFIFTRQLAGLKGYCNDLNIRLLGDLPFYVSYDSADVWANRELFRLDSSGQMELVAGVPPDYFNADGQLWGMPVYNWEVLANQQFSWWMQRIKKNLQYYDLLRLDHFRAFASYWAVPSGEKTAINGSWLTAPGQQLFTRLKQELKDLPLIAEDLGDIDESVYRLRDDFTLPGMKVLQFAWGTETPVSPHIPHNYSENFVVYTGTHDNNTSRGWYRKDAGQDAKKSLRQYIGQEIGAKDISDILIKLALGSVARTAIIPVQDWLNLKENSRLNTPAAFVGNWIWRLTQQDLKLLPLKKISKWTKMYNR